MHFILDPVILSLPTSIIDTKKGIDEKESSWKTYVDNLRLWADPMQDQNHKFWLSASVYEALIASRLYPSWTNLQHIATILPKDRVQDVQDISKLVSVCENGLLKPSFLEEIALDESHEVYDDSLVVIPKKILDRLSLEVREALAESLIYTAVVTHQGLNDIFDSLHFASVPNGFSEETLEVSIEAYDVDLDQDEEIQGKWEILTHPKQIDQLKGIGSFWQDIERGLLWAEAKLNSENCKLPGKIPYTVGGKFYKSIEKTHLNKDIAALESLFEELLKLLCGQIKQSNVAKGTDNHPIRERRNSHEIKTRRRDGAEAWRLRLQGQWRLHYWLLKDGSIELANVEKGHSMHIES